jgi:hypothetical protein
MTLSIVWLTIGIIFARSVSAERIEKQEDYQIIVECTGTIRWEVKPGWEPSEMPPIGGVYVYLYDAVREASLPVDITNYRGRFVVDDRFSYGVSYWTDSTESTDADRGAAVAPADVIGGTWETPKFYLRCEKAGFRTTLYPLAPNAETGRWKYDSPLEIHMPVIPQNEGQHSGVKEEPTPVHVKDGWDGDRRL